MVPPRGQGIEVYGLVSSVIHPLLRGVATLGEGRLELLLDLWDLMSFLYCSSDVSFVQVLVTTLVHELCSFSSHSECYLLSLVSWGLSVLFGE